MIVQFTTYEREEQSLSLVVHDIVDLSLDSKDEQTNRRRFMKKMGQLYSAKSAGEIDHINIEFK